MRRRAFTATAVTAALAGSLVLASISGAAAAAGDHEPSYYLPAPAGTPLIVAAGNDYPFGRVPSERYAFDLRAAQGPERFPVLAARGGRVIGVRDDVPGGRCREPADGPRPSCWRPLNYVLIDHGDGTSGLYMHLKRGTSPVHRGQIVATGQRIGTAGTSGWSDGVGVQFQVQPTPFWREVSTRGGFQTRSLPVSFDDSDVASQRADGVPQTDDMVVSSNPGAAFAPFGLEPRPRSLPAIVPFAAGTEVSLDGAYVADAAEGYGLHFSPIAPGVFAGSTDSVPDTEDDAAASQEATPATSVPVRPLFGGELVFAGCATGSSAALGRTVMVGLELEGSEYLGVLGHLDRIESDLLDVDLSLSPLIVGPDSVVGSTGHPVITSDASPACPGADDPDVGVFAAILRDATVSPEGEIIGGTPVSLEPLVGERPYEGFRWWAGPMVAAEVAAEPGHPRASWNRRTPAHATHIPYGDVIRLTARVRDVTDIAEVRFRAWYPRWPRPGASAALPSFDPAWTWRELAACRPDGGPDSSDCTWNGDEQDALVTYRWDPTATETADIEPWLPRARTAMTRSISDCVPVSLAVEVIDHAGHVRSGITQLPRAKRCDLRRVDRGPGRVLYLDGLEPPRAPAPRGDTSDRGWPPIYDPDPLNGAIVWRDRADDEDGFRVFARRSWLRADCTIANGSWRLVATLPANKTRYRPAHNAVKRGLPVPEIDDVPGYLDRWEYAVAAYNQAGRSALLPVGGFVGGSEAFCDTGLEPPPDL